jgi:arsenite-transporting ATPase
LIDEVVNNNTGGRKTIFVGGKGGVGKTTVSSALAVELASHPSQDLKVLVVSTDPAHSLADALDVDLRQYRKSGGGSSAVTAIQMTDPLTRGNLYAAEIDAENALQDFRDSLAGFDVDRLASSLGVPPDLLEGLGLREFSGLLNNPPPGLDELVALGNVMDENNINNYDVVIVDTAPTGHTLRLLQLPKFLDGLLGKLLKLRMKLSNIANTLQAFLGDSGAQGRANTIDTAMDKLDQFRMKISKMEDTLRDPSKTSFVVVTVPTKLAVEESKRLVHELQVEQGIAVNHIVVNQCVGDIVSASNDADDPSSSSVALAAYYERRRDNQSKWIEKLSNVAADISASEEYRNNGDPSPITITQIPFYDVELVGVPALGYVGAQELVNNPNFKHLMSKDDSDNAVLPKVVICGGKGGVGKTTTSSSLAVSMAAQGHRVALISTDPAHSLGDAIDMDLRGGKLIDCPLVGVPGATGEGSLSVMEIDPTSALSQFKGIVDKLIGGGDDAASGNSELRSTLQDLESVFDTLPAGTDEVVALAKVVNLIKKGDFDRIVLDTAPTGHTLRMISTPGFIAELIERLLEIAQKVNSNAAVKMLISSAAARNGKKEEVEAAATTAKSQLLSFQLQMYDLEDLFANPDQTNFLIVTIATELAVRESVRLLNDLTYEAPDMPIKVANIVINQVLKQDGSDIKTFLSHVSDGQTTSINDLKQGLQGVPNPPQVTTVQYLDTEPRGVFGLKVLGDALLKEADTQIAA